MSFLHAEYSDDEYSNDEYSNDKYSDDEDDVLQPTCKRHKLANDIALRTSISSGLYPEFLGREGPVERHSPGLYNALDYLKLLWPDALTSLIVTGTNRYARWKKRTN